MNDYNPDQLQHLLEQKHVAELKLLLSEIHQISDQKQLPGLGLFSVSVPREGNVHGGFTA